MHKISTVDDIEAWLEDNEVEKLHRKHECYSINNSIRFLQQVILDLFTTNFDFNYSFSRYSDILSFYHGFMIDNKKQDKLAVFTHTSNFHPINYSIISLQLTPGPYFANFTLELEYGCSNHYIQAKNLFGKNITAQIHVPIIEEILIKVINEIKLLASFEIKAQHLSVFGRLLQKKIDY